ncbi:MAG: PAS-domain containing protein [Caulobacteraceae bacterium]|nr:PAS-domain containing protein [Caulobacteraceae bacterium]
MRLQPRLARATPPPSSERLTPVLDAETQADAFGFVIFASEDDQWRVVAGESVLATLAARLGVAPEPTAVIGSIGQRSGTIAESVAALERGGRPFEISLELADSFLRLRGAATGGIAWLRLESASLPAAARSATPTTGVARVRERLEQAYDLTLDHLSDAVAVFGPDQRLERFNEAFARLWELEPAWLGARPRHSDWLERLRQSRRLADDDGFAGFKARELARYRSSEVGEALWRAPGGRTIRVVCQPHPEGGLILVATDVTSELDLKSRFNQLVKVQQATLDKLTDAVAVFGADARLRLHNEAFQSFWGLPTQVLGEGAPFDDLADYGVARVHDLQFWRSLKARITDPDPALRAASSGEIRTAEGRWTAWQSRPLPDGATLIGFTDITDAKRLEDALADREAALGAAERLKSDFVAAVSRELRIPLTTVIGYAELLETAAKTLPERERGWIGAVRAAAAALAGSIEDILAIAELDAGERRLSLERLDLRDLISQAAARWAQRFKTGGIELALETTEEPVTIEGDTAALAAVLDHLIDNAVAGTPGGGRVAIGAERAHGQVRLSVADTGRGIPFDVQARLFERFSGLEGAGAGLGLALVKALVELHGGWVSVESEPGRGARFTCHLPEGQAHDESPERT